MKALPSSRLVLGLAVLALPPACVTETTRQEFASPGTVPITRTQPERAWRVESVEEVHGFVVLFSDPERLEDLNRQYFSVRNVLHQELGTIDALGRAWRFVPHQREAHMLGAGTVIAGARSILGAGPGAELTEVPLAELRGTGPVPLTGGPVKSLPADTPLPGEEPRPRP